MKLLFREKKMRYLEISFAFFVFLGFLLISSFASAVELKKIPGNIHIGQLKVHPGLSVREEYTDNLFHEYCAEKGSSITTVSPGIVFQLPFQRHFLQMDYRVDLIEAERYHRQYDTDSHFANLILNLNFNKKFL